MGVKWISIEEEKVAVKKGLGGWRVVHPPKNEDGTYNKKNILLGGSWWYTIKLLLVVICLLLLTLSYSHDLKECSQIANYVAENPCDWCYKIQQVQQENPVVEINLTIVNELFKNE